MKILIIGVGSAGVIAADKMEIPNSKKLFVDSDYYTLRKVKSEGEKIAIACKERDKCPSLYCHCYLEPCFTKERTNDYEEEIRAAIKQAFAEDNNTNID